MKSKPCLNPGCLRAKATPEERVRPRLNDLFHKRDLPTAHRQKAIQCLTSFPPRTNEVVPFFDLRVLDDSLRQSQPRNRAGKSPRRRAVYHESQCGQSNSV